MRFLKLLAGFLPLLLLGSCENNRLKVNISHIKDEITFVRFYEELFFLGSSPEFEDLRDLRSRHPGFADLFSFRILRTGSMVDTSGWLMMRQFLSDSTTHKIRQAVNKQFPSLARQEKDITSLFRHYRYHFPEKSLPEVFFTVSGFNESVFTAEGIVGISLDKYLGSECEFYSLLDLPQYKIRRMNPGMIPSDVAYTWGMTEFPISPGATTLLDHMIYEGKLMYFSEAMLPRTADTLRMGFSARQLKWCAVNEAHMWNYLVEKELLFSTRQMDIVRYINDGPTTNSFPLESPGRTGVWLGRQIIRLYMKRNPEVTLPQLMSNDHYLEILNSSAYAPQ